MSASRRWKTVGFEQFLDWFWCSCHVWMTTRKTNYTLFMPTARLQLSMSWDLPKPRAVFLSQVDHPLRMVGLESLPKMPGLVDPIRGTSAFSACLPCASSRCPPRTGTMTILGRNSPPTYRNTMKHLCTCRHTHYVPKMQYVLYRICKL